MIPKHRSVFSLPMPKSCCKCHLGCWHFSLRLSRVLKASHWEWRTEIVSQTLEKCGAYPG